MKTKPNNTPPSEDILHSQVKARLLATMLCLAALGASATVHYVDANSTNAVSPYTTWETAATNIQAAINVAAPGDEVVVTNGLYATGGRAVFGAMTNRVAVNKPLLVRSVNGPEFTVIQGRQIAGTTNGPGAVRCVYLTNGAVLSGFTLTRGATLRTGDSSKEQDGGGAWCESVNAVLTNCTLTGNAANSSGGAVYRGTLNRCTLTRNWATYGGGASESVLNNCTLSSNKARKLGEYDGSGGGAAFSDLNNCALYDNSADEEGGGAYDSTLNHCTVTGNTAYWGGGVYGGGNCSLTNCIVYYNTATSGNGEDNYPRDYYVTLSYCCTTPPPPQGMGNITTEPQLASASHLSAVSPCHGAGFGATGTDIDGEAWGVPPSIGCDEYWSGAVTGALSVAMTATWTNVGVDYPVNFRALIEGRTSASAWDFGDGTVQSNRLYASHAWASPGTYTVTLRAWNESNPDGVSATVTVQVTNEVHYVALESQASFWPYSSWETAATNIQDAVDAAVTPGASVLVSNGVYATGGRAVYLNMFNRVVVNKPLLVRSVNGPEFTFIQGAQVPVTTNGPGAIRCVYLTNGAILNGFTLTGGATCTNLDDGLDHAERGGGGVWCESAAAVVTNCTLRGNSADGGGGGAFRGTLYRCTLSTNWAGWGGGACLATLNECIASGNSASGMGGGVEGGTLYNCVLSSNTAFWGGGADYATLINCNLIGNSTSGFYAENVGGGSTWSFLYNCRLTGNSACSGGGSALDFLINCTLTGNSALVAGGGAYSSLLNNCILTGNSAGGGGGAANCYMLNNCTLVSNTAAISAGGVGESTLVNCVIYFNQAPEGPNYSDYVTLNSCCTTPQPTNGVGNITNAPLFVDLAGGDLHLLPGSPCVNAGDNNSAPGPFDLDGNPRIVGGMVDMGAYEYQSAVPPTAPRILVADGNFGWGTNGAFGFNFSGSSGQVVVVEASTNLLNWEPLATNTLGADPLYFCESGCTNFLWRFYRLFAP